MIGQTNSSQDWTSDIFRHLLLKFNLVLQHIQYDSTGVISNIGQHCNSHSRKQQSRICQLWGLAYFWKYLETMLIDPHWVSYFMTHVWLMSDQKWKPISLCNALLWSKVISNTLPFGTQTQVACGAIGNTYSHLLYLLSSGLGPTGP